MAAANDREEVALSLSELDDVLSSAGLAEGEPATPEDDLELYGVWVKAKPQPVARSRTAAPAAELEDLEGEESATGAVGSELTEDEQDLLAELETGVPEETPAMERPPLEPEAQAEEAIPSLLHEETLLIDQEGEEVQPPPLEDFELEEPAAEAFGPEPASLDEELASLGEESAETAAFPPLDEEEISLDSSLSLDEAAPSLEAEASLEIPALDEPIPSLGEEMVLEAAEEPILSIDETLPSLEGEIALEEPVDLDMSLPSLEEDLTLEEPPAPTALEEELTLEESASEELTLEEPVSDELVLEEPAAEPAGAGIQELEAAEAHEPETPFSTGEAELGGIDLEAELPPSSTPAPSREAPAERKADAAALVLEKIEQELHAIRREISDLRDELTVLRTERDDLVGGQEPEAEEAPSGFFGGEEDETIALTGDELDNILSTADVTEEKEQEVAEEAPLDAGSEQQEPLAGEAETGDILAEDILEQPFEEPAAAAETGEQVEAPREEDLLIPEEELVDASGAEAVGDQIGAELGVGLGAELGDESSLLSPEPLEDLDLSLTEPEGAIVEIEEIGTEPLPEVELEMETGAEQPMPEELAAELAAEAEAAIAEPRAEPGAEEPVPSDLLLEPSAEGAESFGLELDLADESAEPSAEPEMELDLATLEEPLPAAAELPTEELLTEGMEPSLEVTGIHEADESELVVDEEEPAQATAKAVPDDLRDEIKSVLAYLDQLLEALPDEKIEEFAKSEYFGVYKKLFVELGLED